jgi:hypothetical protein
MLPLLAGCVVFAVGATLVDGDPVGALRDDSMYVVLGKSLATGHGYRWLNLPGTPAATHFPPGYPALLALLWRFAPAFPSNLLLFKLANALCAAVAAIGVARFVRARFQMHELGAQLFAAVAMLSVPMLTFSTHVMSEAFFLALLTITLLRAEDLAATEGWRNALLVGLLAGSTTLVRSSGVALLPAIAIRLLLRRRFQAAVLFAIGAVAVILPWQLWVAAHANALPAPMRGNYESYTALVADAISQRGFGFLGQVAVRTSSDLALMFQYLVAPVARVSVRVAALGALAVLVIAGVRPMWRKAPVCTVFLAAYALIVLLWPYTPGRFIWCVWPFVLLLPVTGVRALLDWRVSENRLRIVRTAGLAAAAALSLGYAVFNISGYRSRVWATDGYADRLQPLMLHVASRTSPNAVLATEAENTVYLYTGRLAVPIGSYLATDYLQPRGSREIANSFAVVLARYHPAAIVVATPYLRSALGELALRQPPVLAAVDSFPGGGAVFIPLRP